MVGVRTPLEGIPSPPWNADAPIAAPLCLYRPTVLPEWVDYNGHMSESCYLLVFGDNSDAFFRFIGVDEHYRAGGFSLYTLQTHLHHLHEVAEGEPLRVDVQLLDVDAKRVHIVHSMFHADTGMPLATAEQMLAHVDMQAGRSALMPEALQQRLQAIRAAHASLPLPAQVGRPLGIRR